MGAWTKNKVDSSLINGGQEYAKGDNVPLDQLNAITNNSFYAVDKADEALVKANSAFENNGTVVKVANNAVTGLNFDTDPQTQIDQLEDTVNSKANQSALDGTNSTVSIINNMVESLSNSKADVNASNLTSMNVIEWQNKLNNLEVANNTARIGQATVGQVGIAEDGKVVWRVHTDGFKEVYMLYRKKDTKITFPEPVTFSTTNYLALVTEDNPSMTSWEGTSHPAGIYNKKVDSLYIGSSSGVTSVDLYCCGY